MLVIKPIENFPIINENDNVAEIILKCLDSNNEQLVDNEILIIAQSIISRAEGRVVNLETIEPSVFAKEIAEQCNKEPQLIEMILRESKNICKFRNGVLITETKHGFVCANSGIDRSNIPGENTISLLPLDPDKSAQEIRAYIKNKIGKDIAIIISDTHNRPFRLGAINIAIGCSGINPLKKYIDKEDLFNFKLKSSIISDADQLCSAAGLVMGEANEGFPVIRIIGYKYQKDEISAKELIRPEERDYFR